MSIKNKGVLRVGVPSMQDLQKWATQSQSSEDYKQLTLETFEASPQWLAERREHKSSISLRVRQISASACLLAFITGNNSLEPLLEGLFAQIHIDLS